jgi:hypothetical protein
MRNMLAANLVAAVFSVITDSEDGSSGDAAGCRSLRLGGAGNTTARNVLTRVVYCSKTKTLECRRLEGSGVLSAGQGPSTGTRAATRYHAPLPMPTMPRA